MEGIQKYQVALVNVLRKKQPVWLIGKDKYDDVDWFTDNPNRAGGTVVAWTDATVAQYCSYIKEILTADWAVSNRPAVEVSAFG